MSIMDMHCDTIHEILKARRQQNNYGGLRKNPGHIDLGKLKQSDYLVQNFAMYVNLKEAQDPWDEVEMMLDLFDQEMEANQDLAMKVQEFGDIRIAREAGKVGCMMTVEEGGVCKGEIEKLNHLYQRGVRMLTLTWNYPNELGYPNVTLQKDLGKKPDLTQPNTKDGLTAKGKEFVQAMEDMGMIIDVSHLSDAGFYDVLDVTKCPFVASHSNSRAIASNVRNMTDDMIRKLANRGGVAGINLCRDFLDDLDSSQKNHGSMEAVIRHMKHMVQVGGEDFVGLGTDFDGISTNPHIPDASAMAHFATVLCDSGFGQDTVDRIMFQNVLRVYRELL